MTAAKPFYLQEAAERLHVTPRWLEDWLCQYPLDPKTGEPFFVLAGRLKLFTEADVARIYAALRELTRCRYISERPAKAKRPTTKSAGPTSGSLLSKARALIARQSPARSCATSSEKSNVVNLANRQRKSR
jgi:hypothetical protein